jgi:5'-nucleotidase
LAYKIEEKFVVAIASSALFDLSESDRIFTELGEEAYRKYQREKEDVTLSTGVAYPLVRRLLSINGEDPDDQPVEVVLLSRNDADTGLRVFKSIEMYSLPITRAVFAKGGNPFLYMDAFNASLFLSGNLQSVQKAVELGFPAGRVFPTDFVDDEDDQELRIAFDFDGILADDSAETVFQEGQLPAFLQHEKQKAGEPLPAGPLLKFVKELSKLQQREYAKKEQNSEYKPRIRIAIATARNAPAHERVISTVRDWGIQVDEAFFLGGIDKERVLKVFKPHIFFDDQLGHIEGVSKIAPSVHVPFGIANKRK